MLAASTKFPLRGWYVISLRPLHQHGGVRRASARAGATAFALSTLRLQPLEAATAISAALACERIIVTSPAAARLAHGQHELQQRPRQTWFALGPGTAAALHRRGVRNVLTPARGSDSEALLDRQELQAIKGQSIGLLTAPGGRDLLPRVLRQRGAIPIVAQVYRREALVPAAARLRAMQALPARCALLVSSEEAFNVLWQSLDRPGQSALTRRVAVASSPRLTALLEGLGFIELVRAPGTRPADMIGALADHVRQRQFR